MKLYEERIFDFIGEKTLHKWKHSSVPEVKSFKKENKKFFRTVATHAVKTAVKKNLNKKAEDLKRKIRTGDPQLLKHVALGALSIGALTYLYKKIKERKEKKKLYGQTDI
jgi:hypothetical protein